MWYNEAEDITVPHVTKQDSCWSHVTTSCKILDPEQVTWIVKTAASGTTNIGWPTSSRSNEKCNWKEKYFYFTQRKNECAPTTLHPCSFNYCVSNSKKEVKIHCWRHLHIIFILLIVIWVRNLTKNGFPIVLWMCPMILIQNDKESKWWLCHCKRKKNSSLFWMMLVLKI